MDKIFCIICVFRFFFNFVMFSSLLIKEFLKYNASYVVEQGGTLAVDVGFVRL